MSLAANFAEQASVGYLVESSQPASTFQDAPAHPGFAELVDRETRSSRHLMIGEPHVDAMTDRTFALLADSPEAFQLAARNGVKHLVLETPQSEQGKYDDFMSGKISREEMVAHLKNGQFSSISVDDDVVPADIQDRRRQLMAENITRTLENARDAGMQVHCVDTSAQRYLNQVNDPALKALEPFREEYFAQHPEDRALFENRDHGAVLRVSEFCLDKVEALPPDQQEQLRSALQKEDDERIFSSKVSRFEADLEVYGLIRERIPPNEKMIGVFGNGHLENPLDFSADRSIRGIDELLEQEGATVTTIGLRSRSSDVTVDKMHEHLAGVPIDPVDYTIYLDDGVIQDRGKNPIGNLESGLHSNALDQMYSPNPSQPVVQGQALK